MESELVRQAEILFGEAMTRRLRERAAEPDQTPAAVAAAAGNQSTAVAPAGQPAAEPLENTPPLL